MDKEIYQRNSDYFLIASKTFRRLKQQGKLNRKEIKEIEKKLTAMSFWLLLNTEKNNQNPAIVKGRLQLCLRNLNKLNTPR
ncbi:MAG: hypothetical protein V1491_00520 [archaeon]